ncbi:SusC/RagA family TonB-linked outer membrane protein [Reichenbachiella versicolor]|uniref:SusC/RagA family TonB-linked outer membrane protein n=1 Tax=Reichenbachiella versicolor TaxID=1821036 RepID=UPI0013A5A683|nr:TonB-dependent receptor [Reichenbachiella versicolor]
MKRIYSLIVIIQLTIGSVLAQDRQVKGRVLDEFGEALVGATVTIKGTSKGTMTDMDGYYTVNMPNEANTLVFSFIGLSTQEFEVGSQSVIDVTMIYDIEALGEVVVVGYGVTKKDDLTGATAKVKTDELSPTLATSVDELLKGRIAGLQVTSNSGAPGAGSTIRIRGTNSFFGTSDPLLVVDGIPIGPAGNLTQLNTNDIESISVLKDASSAAIYGSRGASGVILVTTKKGVENDFQVEANYQMSVSTLPRSFDLITDPYLYALLENEADANRDALPNSIGTTVRYVGATNPENGLYYPSLSEIRNGAWQDKTYWPDEVFQDAFTHNASVAVRGGTEKSRSSISLGYLNQDGIVKGNEYDRLTLKTDLENQVWKNVKVGINSNLAYINQTIASTEGAIYRNPVFPVRDTLGGFHQVGQRDFFNPGAVRNRIKNESESFDLFSNLYLEWEIISGLTFKSYVRNVYKESVGDYYEPTMFGNQGSTSNGYGTISNSKSSRWVYDNTVSYVKGFGKHKIDALIGTSYEEYGIRTSTLIGTDFVNDYLENEDLNSAGEKNVHNSYVPLKLNSYLARIKYNFDDKYLVTFNGRADGSSKFGKNNRFGYFSSGAIGWNLHKENFFPVFTPVNKLKIRGSYGVTGDQSALQPFMSLDLLDNSRTWLNGQWTVGFGPGIPNGNDSQGRTIWAGVANPSLKWETTVHTDVGVELGLFESALNIELDFYHKETHDLLRRAKIAPSSGFNEQWQNDGDVLNKGFEIVVDAVAFETEDMSLNLGFNFSRNVSEVLRVEQDIIEENGTSYVVPQFFGDEIELLRAFPNSLSKGMPIYAFYGYKTDGIVQTREEGLAAGLQGDNALPGEIKYVDVDGNGIVDDLDRTFIGDPNPDFTFGFNSTLKWKNFDLRLFFTGAYGNDVLNVDRLNQGSVKASRWTVDNPNNEHPSLVSARSYRLSSYFIEDGSYVKFQNASLTYHVPANSVFSLLSVNFNVENIATWTKFSGYDPEVGVYGVYWGPGVPRPRVFTLGVNARF